ncbi:DsbE family thiol:disulfide interchange protein [Shimia isoporae]|nr:DsbE family thiol:disulfide interchange protein [Shimia isoporae]
MLLPPILFGGLALLFLLGMNRDNPDELPSALVGRQAPAVQVSQFSDMQMVTDADLRSGEMKLVNFWASWCGPCRVEHPNLMALQAEGIEIIGVNYKDPATNAVRFLAELGDPYAKGGADTTGRMALNWGVYGVPETYLIDGDGNVVERIAGPVTQREIEERLRPAMDSLQKQ